MFAVVEIAGMQVKVETGTKIWVPLLAKHQPGEKLSFENVLFFADGANVKLGMPTVSGAKVEATLVKHAKGPKIIVFKKRRRKAFQKKHGHRQDYSVLSIEDIKL